jgi:hypothetical protein
LGLFVEHLVGAQKIKGLKIPFKSTQPPAKTAQKPTQNSGAQSKSGEMGFREKWKKNGKNGQMAASGGWKWPAVVRWVVGK